MKLHTIGGDQGRSIVGASGLELKVFRMERVSEWRTREAVRTSEW